MRLKEIREDRDITQAELAAYLNVKQNTYSQYENGQRQIPLGLLIKLAEYYKTSTDYILEITDEKTPYPPKKTIVGICVKNIISNGKENKCEK